MSAALLVCVGAVICAWAVMTPGDQIAVAFIGGALIGTGIGVRQ